MLHIDHGIPLSKRIAHVDELISVLSVVVGHYPEAESYKARLHELENERELLADKLETDDAEDR